MSGREVARTATVRQENLRRERQARLDEALEIIRDHGGSALSNTTIDVINTVHWRVAQRLASAGLAEIYIGPDGGRWARLPTATEGGR